MRAVIVRADGCYFNPPERLGGLEAGPGIRSWHSRRERAADQLLHPASG